MDLFNVVSIKEAKSLIEKNFNVKPIKEEVELLSSMDRVIYEDIVSHINVPNFRRSTVDGYAVNSKDVAGASESMPAMMNYRGEVFMGKIPEVNIDFPGDCVYVPTGGMIPEGSDSVIMVEYTERVHEDTVLINKATAYGEKVVEIGEDIAKEEVIIKKGERLRPYEIGVLSSLGITKVPVCRNPKVAIISTGDEIVDPNKEPNLGEVRDINSYLLQASIIEDGGIPINYGIIRDDFNLLKNTVEKAIEDTDIVLISGGSSVGKKDVTIDVINSLGDPGVFVHGIAIKPGKPTIIGNVKDKIVFGLPGHPLSAAVVYKVIVKYYIDKIAGVKEKVFPIVCKFNINYHSAKGREEYLPVTLNWQENEIIASPIFSKSGLISGFSKAYGFIKMDKNLEGIKKNEKVFVYRF
ncbi:molybdopterin molybdotransferase MoeA [Clostridium botulinum]|uniref:Molybdopterin molybdenumtransferase n=1 Tax=Clostridium botulinum (strain Hall / ATCC 3502 / NCTC 13319 / Type A) TaxID=441771 RepID=A5I367_CLOBH|nr:gephyrin-like molybdotransferase Glp [Clostridium botulinum]ABS35473.1 molybdopterin biosynthesis enzyme MoeA [Clostridium botulinum A str. ATCC 19397]ABS36933.1 molybdopterin biosynthesis enzyme MoeA [Clostridium botulinum A str. Hall]AWB17815.1 molybdopterin molybdenumtransferase MoeA [Clostridium botulinum]AWB30600.1 molybdopterin molybdenumtransferase MoeA [Clostridium botulinum]EGT5614543.1 molybdopterin molybdenumtransferase MoeA [Clostridium botulinum]